MTSIPTWKYLRALPAKITNKYVIALIAFVVWMTFFDKNNFLAQHEYSQTIKELNALMDNYESEMAQLDRDYHHMLNNTERYAREQHLRHKKNERLFLLRESPDPGDIHLD